MSISRRTALQAGVSAVAGSWLGTAPSLAQASKAFPTRAIKLVVAFPAGGRPT
jgi:tripartite-type tricarboxylate transporter receptor subunit TctC